jgi:hypothetical protein
MADPRAERRQNLKALAIAGGILAALAGIAVFVAAKPQWFMSTGGKQYGSSLADKVPIAAGAGGCGRQEGEDWWWCGVEFDAGSGYGASYVLRTRSEACWTAHRATVRRVRNEPPKRDVFVIAEDERAISGCVGIWDYVSPDNPYGFNADREDPPWPFVLRSG